MYSMTNVEPVSPASGYFGGKRNLVRRIVPLIDGTPHERYAEPFVGMGGIFLKRRRRPRVEYINDVSGDVRRPFFVSDGRRRRAKTVSKIADSRK